MMRFSIFSLLLTSLLSIASSQANWQVLIDQPKEGEVFGWAQTSPSVTIQASLQLNGKIPLPNEIVKRLFLTAQVFANDRLLDNVPLWDDGTHGDKKAKDGIFTSTYNPPQTGEFRLRVRAQADLVQNGKVVTKEFWSNFLTFKVVPVPYPRLIYPEPASKTRTTLSVRARLLVNNEPFEERDETLQARIIAQAEGKKVTEATLRRKGSVLTGKITLPRRGEYQLLVIVSVQRQGKTLQAQSELVTIQAVHIPIFWLIVGLFLIAIYLLLPPKEPPLRYRHQVRVGQNRFILEAGERRSVNGIEVVGAKDKPEVTVQTPEGLRKIFQEQQNQQLSWLEGNQRRIVEVTYERAEPLRDKPSLFSRLLPLTLWRFVFLAIALLSFAYWWHQLQQIR